MEINVVIRESAWKPEDLAIIFDEPNGPPEPFALLSAPRDMPELLVSLKCFKSKTEARNAGRGGPVPTGFTEFRANKTTKLWIWNPTE